MLLAMLLSFFFRRDKDTEDFKHLKPKVFDISLYKRPIGEPKPPKQGSYPFEVHLFPDTGPENTAFTVKLYIYSNLKNCNREL